MPALLSSRYGGAARIQSRRGRDVPGAMARLRDSRSRPAHRRVRLRRLAPAPGAAAARAARARAGPRPRARLPAEVDARRGDAVVRRRARRGARRLPHRLLPHPLDGPRLRRRPPSSPAATARRRSTSARRRATPASSAWSTSAGSATIRPALGAPALAPRGRRAAAPARARARLRARGDDHRRGQRVVRDAAPPDEPAAGDDHPALARHPHPADRDRGRRARARRPGRAARTRRARSSSAAPTS